MLYGCVLRKVVLVIFNFMQNMLLLIFAWFFYYVEDVHTGNGIATNLFLEGFFFYCCFVSVILDMLFFLLYAFDQTILYYLKERKIYQVRWQPFLITNKTKCWINVYETPEFNNLSAVLYVWSYNLFRCYVLWYWYCKVVLIRTL